MRPASHGPDRDRSLLLATGDKPANPQPLLPAHHPAPDARLPDGSDALRPVRLDQAGRPLMSLFDRVFSALVRSGPLIVSGPGGRVREFGRSDPAVKPVAVRIA